MADDNIMWPAWQVSLGCIQFPWISPSAFDTPAKMPFNFCLFLWKLTREQAEGILRRRDSPNYCFCRNVDECTPTPNEKVMIINDNLLMSAVTGEGPTQCPYQSPYPRGAKTTKYFDLTGHQLSPPIWIALIDCWIIGSCLSPAIW